MKKTKIIAIILILFFGIIACGDTFAIDQKMLGAELNRPFNDDNGDGTVGNDRYVLEDNHNIFTATKIYDKDDVTEYLSSIYCLRGGKGFGEGVSELNNNSYAPVQYNKIGNLKENAKAVIEEYENLYGVNLNREEEITFDGITKKVNLYNALLWITDNAYLPKDIKNIEGEVIYSASEYRAQLLNKAGITSNQSQGKITDDDIEVVQQFAIWYFVNYDEQAKENFATVSKNDNSIMGKVKIGNGTKFEDYEMSENVNELNTLYQFFIKSAIENAEKYGTEDIRQNEVDTNNLPKLEDTKPQNSIVESAKSKEYSVFGPFEITGQKTDLAKIDMYFKNGDNEEKIEKNPLIVIVNNPEDMIAKASSLEEVIGQGQFYIKMPKIENLSMLKIVLTNSYYKTTSTAWEADQNAKENQAVVIIEREKITAEDVIETEEPKEFDLSLRKFITSIDREEVEGRTPQVDLSTLVNGRTNEQGEKEYTATYKHNKNALEVETGSKVIYTIRVYNEGQIAGTATEVTDYLPEGLKFISPNESTINNQYKWTISEDGKTVKTDYLKDKTIEAFEEGKELDYEDLKIECEVIAEVTNNNQVLRNIAAITADTGDDRDSEPEEIVDRGENYNPPADNSTYQQDDDDYELLILKGKNFDLALRKIITKVERNGKNVEIKNARNLVIDTTKLESGESTTAEYKHRKDPVEVEIGDIVTYSLRVYNENKIAGYVTSVVDYLPEGVEFVPTEEFIEYSEWENYYSNPNNEQLSQKYVYQYNEETRKLTITSQGMDIKTEVKPYPYAYLFKLEAYDKTHKDEANWISGLNYGEINIKFKVTASIKSEDQILTNIASMNYVSHGINKLADIDSREEKSNEDKLVLPNSLNTVDIGYKGNESNKNELNDNAYHYEGQQDDDDFEKIIIKGKSFDLSLRKFITSIDGKEVEGRIPQEDTSKLASQETTTATYKHDKNALEVQTGSKVIYTIRVYNEGQIDGTATEVTDYLPDGLKFVPVSESTINSQYKWVLSEDEKTLKTDYLKDKTIQAFEEGKELDYEDLKIECEVIAQVSENNQILRNIAAITGDTGDDRDSEPEHIADRGEGYNPPADNSTYQQDDDDYELLILKGKYFDLSLRKFITSVEREGKKQEIANREPKIYIQDLKSGTATTARYVHPKNLLTLKKGDIITYTLRIYNEGELDGYATLVKDYLPEGLELVEGKNDIWTVDGNTLSTDSLKEQKLLAYNKNSSESNNAGANWQKAEDDQSGLYYLDLQVVCRIKDTVENGQVLKNVAEIYNHKAEVENDRDSVPGNVYQDEKHEPGNEVNGYTPGEQDDDDFERITIESNEIFDLALRKYIVAVNGVELKGDKSRVPQVDTKPLQQLETTANYNHKKEPVSVKAGDEITYRFATYNEGNIDGYVYSIIDYLPEYLEFTPTEEFISMDKYTSLSKLSSEELENEDLSKVKYVYEFDVENKKVTVRDFHNPQLTGGAYLWGLKAYDGGDSLDSKYIDLKFKVKESFVSEKDIILTNSATMEYGSYIPTTTPNDYKDRDSESTTFTVPTQEQLVSENKVAYKGDNTNKDDLNDSKYYYKGQQDDDDFEKIIIKGKSFDLALRKYITGVEVSDTNSHGPSTGIRIPEISIEPLKQGETTAEYKHRKDPVEVEIGNIVAYRFTVYNEGDIDGYVYSIVDYLPEGLTFDAEANTNFIEYKEEYLENELAGKEYAYKIEGNKVTILPVNTSKLFELSAFNGETLDSKSVDVKFKVTAKQLNEDQVLTNVATMTYGAKDANIADRDSNDNIFTVPTAEELLQGVPGYKGHEENKTDLADDNYHYKGQEDDDDFEKLIIKGKAFDLSLRKFITSVERNGKLVEFEDRTPKIDTTTLINGTFSRNGQNEYTATYEHSKEPLIVKQGDIVTYTLRIYNEGERAGYATEITDYIPEGLALIVQHKGNQENKWKLPANIDTSKVISLVGQNGFYKTEAEVKNIELEDLSVVTSLKEVQLVTGKVNVTTDALKDELIKPFDAESTKDNAGQNWQAASKGEGGLYYRDIELTCLVIEENTSKDILTNIAEISQDKDENKQDVTDRDSTPNNVNSKNEDDDDYEPIMLKYFDLALRKFITGVENKGTTTEITSRIPKLTMGENGQIQYEHSKEPVEVVTGNTVIYTLRVYNEGTIAGYAEEIKDNIPEGLKYLPEHKINKQYEWAMVDKDGNITKNAEEAVEITTDYLSQSKEVKKGLKITDEVTGKVAEPITRENIINPFDSSKQISDNNPVYKDVKVAFEVIELETSDRIIVNSAQISEDSDDDEDSVPDKWNEGEDDQDKEYIYVKCFDLSLLKWVTKSIVTVDGKTTTTQTGFKPNQGKTETTGIRNNQEAEPIAKVELDRKKLNKTTVKFTYKIRVTNEGEIAGYATEITDYIPEGLEFYPEDETNKKYGWVKTSDSKITTRALETVLLEPNESAELEITFRWKNNANNIGLKTNIAEISEDYNEYGTKDIDSISDNMLKPYEKEQEDDDDFALVILTIATGKGSSYFAIITTVLAILATGIYLIKKYVLIY